ncbi:MAG TPA: aldo/keto reductase, partial [Thermoanaerobaculia bacterium]|nr:aldo/keto reductase [Thermoanaerobaculia bacterium]
TLGRTGERISAIGFGAMPLSIKGRPPEEQGRAVINAVLDAGVTLIDTADVYCLNDGDLGHNERLITSAIRERPDRDQIRIATKGGLRRPGGDWTRDGTPKHIREACERSLRALAVDQIWLYQFHSPDPSVPFEKSVETFAELQRQGKCRHVGLSNVTVEQIDQASAIVQVQSVQNRLNLYFRESIGVAEECARRQITFLAYGPVGGGRLTKKIPEFPVLQNLAASHRCSPHAIVLAWVRSKAATVVPIPGARTPEHAIDSAGSVELELTPDEIEKIDRSEFSRV